MGPKKIEKNGVLDQKIKKYFLTVFYRYGPLMNVAVVGMSISALVLEIRPVKVAPSQGEFWPARGGRRC